MELKVTFFIKFAIVLHIILALFFIILKKARFLLPFDFPSIMISFFEKLSIFKFQPQKSYIRYC